VAQRVYRLAEHWIVLKEEACLGGARPGPLAHRFTALAETILQRQERGHGVISRGDSFTERVVAVRRLVIQQRQRWPERDPRRLQAERDLDELRLATQLYSYAPDYEIDRPTLERLGEILDKFEEDMLDAFRAGVRGHRQAVISFGPAVEVRPSPKIKEEAPQLTRILETRVRALLQDITFDRPKVCFDWPQRFDV
jgi:hypothetical protein